MKTRTRKYNKFNKYKKKYIKYNKYTGITISYLININKIHTRQIQFIMVLLYYKIVMVKVIRGNLIK